MKKYLRPLGLVLAFAMLTAGAYAAASGDSLISLRYLCLLYTSPSPRDS